MEFDSIATGLDASDWEGDYIYAGTQSSCPQYSTSDGMTLRYSPDSWILTALDGGELAYETTDIGPPCFPPNGTAEWTHYSDVNTSIISIQCISTYFPTADPTSSPTGIPTANPSLDPTLEPTVNPTGNPTTEPTTSEPTKVPSSSPTADPSVDPTLSPTMEPTASPSEIPTVFPTEAPVTPAPTIECSRIDLEIPGMTTVAMRVNGVYYEHALTTSNGYPFWTQHVADFGNDSNPTNFVQIKFVDGTWTVLDSVAGVQLEDDSNETALIPPHDAGGSSWTDILDDSLASYTVTIECGNITESPTADPTMDPTAEPTKMPTSEPTFTPTTSEPTEMPSSNPTISMSVVS